MQKQHALRRANADCLGGAHRSSFLRRTPSIPFTRFAGTSNRTSTPHFAHEALKIEAKLGVLLPCNVIVRETSDMKIEVAAVDPVSSMERTGNPALQSTAEEARRLLSNAISAVGT